MPSPDDHRRALGRSGRERRIELGLSFSAAEREWGVRAAWLSRLERGEANPQLNRLTALASAMERQLLLGDVEPEPHLAEPRPCCISVHVLHAP